MLTAWLVAVAATSATPAAPPAAPSAACAAGAIQAQVTAAATQMNAKDLAAARATIAPVLACPVTSSPAYYAHALRAEIAVRQDDWPAVRDALAHTGGLHPETRISPRVTAFVLRADEKLGNAKGFTEDRDVAVTANNDVLARLGRKVETFRAGAATVHAFEAPVRQDALRRLLEFIIVPDAPAAYPRSILLTDDTHAGTGGARPNAPRLLSGGHAWFVDGYACQRHTSLDLPAGTPDGAAPGYEAVKAIVVRTLEKQGVAGPWAGASATDARPSSAGLCANLGWILPGLGARREAEGGPASVSQPPG